LNLESVDDTIVRYRAGGEGLWDRFGARRAIITQAFERLALSPECELVREVTDAYSRA
jgi:hypothetical protein